MKKTIITAVCITAAVAAFATQYSCLSIISESKKIGKWDALKSWIVAANLQDEWNKCAYVSDDYPQYATITNALVSAGVFDEDEIRALMNAAKDTAVSERLIRRVYSNDVCSSSGRVKWHGRQMKQIVDTNAWTKTTIYEDGTKFVDRAARPAPRTVRNVVAMTNGIPARLAAARQRWADAQNNGNATNVTVVIEAGK